MLDELVRPVPSNPTKVCPPILRLVVEAVTNDEQIVDDEYGKVTLPSAVTEPSNPRVVEAVAPTFSQLAESSVEEALPKKRLIPDQVLVSANSVEEAPEPPPEIQVPLMAKQPPERLIPTFDVVVA